MFAPHNTEEIRLAYKSKHNFKRRKQLILLMITDGKKWHYFAVKSLSVLLRGITSNHNGDFYCLNCFHSCRTEKKTQKAWKSMQWSCLLLCWNAWWRQQNMEIQLWRKAIKSSVYDLCWLGVFGWKMHSCQNNLEKSYAEKKLSTHLLVTHCLQIVHLMQQKTNLIVTEGKTARKSFVKTYESMQWNN